MPIVLTAAQNRFLRGQAHDLNAMLQVGGKGLTDAVVAEVASALEHHELIKVKVAATDRERSEEHTSELQSLMRISYAVFGLKKKKDKMTRDMNPPLWTEHKSTHPQATHKNT